MNKFETTFDNFLSFFAQEPTLMMAMLSMLLAGFALYVVLVAIKALTKSGNK